MNRTAAVHEKVALNVTWNSQTKLPFGAIDIAPFKFSRPHPQEFCDTFQIGLCQVNKPLLRATIRAAALAFESKAFHAEALPALVRNWRIRSIAAIKFS